MSETAPPGAMLAGAAPTSAAQAGAAAGGGAPTGEVLFARYAYPPNELGYCGAGDGHELLDHAAGDEHAAPAAEVRRRAAGFEGAWVYLQLLAAAAGTQDPLDPRVVEAYWVGGPLLDVVDPVVFARRARRLFAHQLGADWECLEEPGTHPVPHHQFHVFVVYPWMRLLRKGRRGPALTVLDRCRIRWGQVLDVRGDQLEIRSAPLVWDGEAVRLGPEQPEVVRWSSGGRSLSPPAEPGAWVAAHWDWACDVLTGEQVTALRSATARQLAVSNGPAIEEGSAC